jgi:O-methyltransferase
MNARGNVARVDDLTGADRRGQYGSLRRARRYRRRLYELAVSVSDPPVGRALRISSRESLQPARQRATLYRIARALPAAVAGDVVEAGTHRGGTAVVLALALADQPARRLHLFDRWGDLPDPTPADGEHFVSYARANIPEKLAELQRSDPLGACTRLLHERAGIDPGRVVYHPGWFKDMFPRYSGQPVVLAHLDTDYYESTREALEFVHRQAAQRCIVVVDDYREWEGARRAVDEFASHRSLAVRPLNPNSALLVLRGGPR